MTIAFLSLFFGLITGPYPVELSVNGPVAAVEILLDGQAVARLNGPPWRTRVDFGPALLPHEVVARALDERGREIGRAQAWANFPNPLTKVDILLEGEPEGSPRAAWVTWKHLKGEQPRSVSLTFDGQRVGLDKEGYAKLPRHDFKTLHVLTAEVNFADRETVRKDIAYGGEYGSEVSTELTAVPVRTRTGELPDLEKLRGWFTTAGQTLSVAAVEDGPGEIYIVRSPSAQKSAQALFRSLMTITPDGELRSNPLHVRPELTLGRKDSFRFVFPYPGRFEASGEISDLFDISTPFPTRDGNIPTLLMTVIQKEGSEGPGDALRIADAVALAGLEATAQNRRRAVILVLAGDENDESLFHPAEVQRFLAAIQVPLVVWYLEASFGPGPSLAAYREELGRQATKAVWGEGEVIAKQTDLKRAIGKLRTELDSQRIVLVDGRHLPQSIALTPAAGQVELVGGRP